MFSNIFTLVFLLLLNGWAASGYFYSDKAVELSFPLKNGVYYIAHGGNSSLLNNHYVSDSQKYALAIVKLNTFGNRAIGIYPKELTSYSIWGDLVYSPCAGKMIESVNHLPDNVPFQSDQNNPAGNHIIIECKGIRVILAHLQKGSLIHKVGTGIKQGEALAKVGNSGNTSEPHLHMQVVKNDRKPFLESKGIPITFDGDFLVRNSLVFNSGK